MEADTSEYEWRGCSPRKITGLLIIGGIHLSMDQGHNDTL